MVPHTASNLQEVLKGERILVLHSARRVQVCEVAEGVDENVSQAGHLDLRCKRESFSTQELVSKQGRKTLKVRGSHEAGCRTCLCWTLRDICRVDTKPLTTLNMTPNTVSLFQKSHNCFCGLHVETQIGLSYTKIHRLLMTASQIFSQVLHVASSRPCKLRFSPGL